VLGSDGEVFSWGRNEAGQLGHGDQITRPGPTRVSALSGSKVIGASTGKAHTIFLTEGHDMLGCGACKQGAVGNGYNKKAEHQTKPAPISVGAKFTAVASGTNFNLAIDTDGDVWSWGWSEYGVLGNGSDGQHNLTDGAFKISYEAEATPKRVSKLNGLKSVHIACGQSHCASISGEGIVYTWGNGGYGRLGHKNQDDVWTPKPLAEYLRARFITCGTSHTTAIGWSVLSNGKVCLGSPSVFMWGKTRSATQNAWMYPKQEDELRGWTVHALDTGATHNVVHADSSTISWGSACLSGELGFGEGGKKSSANPAKVDALEGISVAHVACGPANTFLLVESSPAVSKLPEWTPGAPKEEEEATASSSTKPAGKGKRVAEPAGGAKAKKGKK